MGYKTNGKFLKFKCGPELGEFTDHEKKKQIPSKNYRVTNILLIQKFSVSKVLFAIHNFQSSILK